MIDAQLSPHLAPWLGDVFGVEAQAIGNLGLRNAKDRELFQAARNAGAVVMTKDSDFLRLLDEQGPPPQILWVTCGNTSNAFLKELLTHILPVALRLLQQGEPIVEISTSRASSH